MRKYYIYLATLAHMVNDSSQSVIPALLPLFLTKFSISYEQAGALVFANTALSSVLQPLLGYYADRYPMPRLIAIGVLVSSFSIAAMAFATSYEFIFLCSLVAGVGSAIFHPEGAKLANRLGGAKVGKSIGTFAVGGSAGYALGPVLAGICAYHIGMHGLVIYAIMGLIMGGSLLLLMPRILRDTQEMQQALAKKSPHLFGEEPKNDWKGFGKLSVVLFCRAVNFAVINTFIPIYWITVLKLSPTEGSFALTVLFTIGVFVTYLGGILADRYGFVKVLRYALLLWVPSTFFFTNVTDPTWGWILLFPLGFARTIVYSPVVVLGQKYLAKNVGFASGITIGLTLTLGGLIAPGIGWLADHNGIYLAAQALHMPDVIVDFLGSPARTGLQNALQLLNISTVVALVASFFLSEHNRVMYPNGIPQAKDQA